MAGSEPTRFPFGLTTPLGAFRPRDAVIAGYAAVAAVPLALGSARGVSGCAAQLLVNVAVLAGIALICTISRRSRRWPVVLLRAAYGPLLFPVLYRQTATIWPVLHEHPFDAALVHLERTLWGAQPSLEFAQYAPWPWVSELFCAAYYAYYYFIPAVLFTVLLTRGYLAAEQIEPCPVCGHHMHLVDHAVDLAIRRALENNAQVETVHAADAALRLKELGGIGAMLRY